jgi:hypothetical protein
VNTLGNGDYAAQVLIGMSAHGNAVVQADVHNAITRMLDQESDSNPGVAGTNLAAALNRAAAAGSPAVQHAVGLEITALAFNRYPHTALQSTDAVQALLTLAPHGDGDTELIVGRGIARIVASAPPVSYYDLRGSGSWTEMIQNNINEMVKDHQLTGAQAREIWQGAGWL